MTKSTVQVVVEQLRRTPEDLSTAEPRLPKLGGFYAWWARRGCIAKVPGNPHPSEAEFDLFYVGIAPVSATSSATIRSRVRNNHMRGNIASSTFRFTLASLLVDALKLRPIAYASKIVLDKDQNDQLSQWQRENLRLTWHAVSEPRAVEAAVIAALKPPLNLADNHDHPFHATVAQARARLRQRAQPEDSLPKEMQVRGSKPSKQIVSEPKPKKAAPRR